MTSRFEDRPSHQQIPPTREPLVDINADAVQSPKAGLQLKPRRSRSSDAQEQTSAPPPPEPKAQRRRLSEVAPSAAEPPAPQPQPPVGRSRLSDIQPQTAVAEVLEDPGRWRVDDGMPAVAQPDTPAPAEPHEAPLKSNPGIRDLHCRQSLPVAAAGGLLAAVVGAMIWAVVSVATSFQIGWMAVGVGFLVGGVVRILGRGLDKSFGYLGAGLALFGCLLGNYLTNCMVIAREVGLSVTSLLIQINPAAIPNLMIARFHPVDIVFYGLAIYEGYRLSFMRISGAQVRQALGSK